MNIIWMNSNLSAHPLDLSDAEKLYLSKNVPITMCVDPDWMPYEKLDDQGRHVGIAADYYKLFSQMMGHEIIVIPTQSWTQSEEFARARKCDILSMLNESQERGQYVNFTEPFLSTPVVLVTQNEGPFLDGLGALSGKSLAMVKDYFYEDIIKRTFPDVKIQYVKSMDEGFKQVSEGKIHAIMSSLYIVTSRIRELGLSNLKVAGATGYENHFRIGVRNDHPILLGLFQKTIDHLEVEDEYEISRKWISIRLEHGNDYTLLFQVSAGAIFLLFLFAYRHWSIKRFATKLNKANILLEEKTKSLLLLSRTDPLTQVHNRLRMDEALESETLRYTRYKTKWSCIILDVDLFKSINDQYGHNTGDAVLQKLANTLKDTIRLNDILGRWGGEEFLIICPETNLKGALKLAEILRQTVEETPFEHVETLTCSFGVTEFQEGDTRAKLISKADQAMYDAKNKGRNQVCST